MLKILTLAYSIQGRSKPLLGVDITVQK